MASGPEHYREAERLLAEQDGCRISEEKQPCPFCARDADRAQAHATLALAAATALGRAGEGRTMASKDLDAWFTVAAECRKPVTA